MKNDLLPLTAYTEEQRQAAMKKFYVIAPYLNHNKTLTSISKEKAISRRTLHYWVEAYNQMGLKGLLRKTRDDSGTIKIDPHVKKLIEQFILKYKKNSLATIHRRVNEECTKQRWDSPSYYQVWKQYQVLSQGLKTMAYDGQKSYQDKYDLIHRREANYPNEIWQADHTLLDILILDENEKPMRPWLTIILDEYSRGVAGYFLSLQAPSALQTSLTLHQAIWHKQNKDWMICGIPEHFYTDHGSDFTSNHLEQVAVDLKINLIFSAVGVPRGRGKIERFFLSVNQLLLQALPGYLHNNSHESLLTFKELDERINEFVVHQYHHRIHGTTKKTPNNAWNESGFLPNMPESLESLDLLLLHVAKTRKVHSDGIHFQGLRYIDPNLAAYVGETVVIRYDPRDLAEIRIFYEDRYLCTAISPEIANFTVDLKEIVSARNKRKRELKKELDSTKTVIDNVLQNKHHKIEERAKPKSKLKRYHNE